jgi:hypothetical protein
MERCSGFSKTAVAVNDNTFKILLFSMSNEIIEGNEGPVLKIRLRRKADATNETATVSMNNVVLSDVKGNNKNSGSIVSKNIELLSNHSIELKQGWNWYSTYIDINGEDGFSVLKDMLGNNAKIIKSQTEFALYYEEQAIWDGSLKSYDNKVFYMINTFNPLTLEMQGVMTDMSNYEIIKKAKGEIEAARTIGMSKMQTFFHIMLPQIIGNIVPVYMSMFVMCMQITSVASVIGVKEFLSATDSVSSAVLGIVLSIVGYFLIGTLGDFVITRMGKRKHIKAGDVLEKTEVR